MEREWRSNTGDDRCEACQKTWRHHLRGESGGGCATHMYGPSGNYLEQPRNRVEAKLDESVAIVELGITADVQPAPSLLEQVRAFQRSMETSATALFEKAQMVTDPQERKQTRIKAHLTRKWAKKLKEIVW